METEESPIGAGRWYNHFGRGETREGGDVANDSFGGSNERKKRSRFVCDTTQHVNEEIPTSYYGGLLLMNAVTEGREKEREREREREREIQLSENLWPWASLEFSRASNGG